MKGTSLVARGFYEQYLYVLDNNEKFIPMEKVILALAASKDWDP